MKNDQNARQNDENAAQKLATFFGLFKDCILAQQYFSARKNFYLAICSLETVLDAPSER